MSIAFKDATELTSAEWAAREQVVRRFEDAWRHGPRPALEDYLPADERDRRAVLVELVHTDLEYRLKDGEPARVEEYLDRFPELKGDPAAELELITAERDLRRRREPGLAPDEFVVRFPYHRTELLSTRRGPNLSDVTLPLRWTGPQCRETPDPLGDAIPRVRMVDRLIPEGPADNEDPLAAASPPTRPRPAEISLFPDAPLSPARPAPQRGQQVDLGLVPGVGPYGNMALEGLLRRRMRIGTVIALGGFTISLMLDVGNGSYNTGDYSTPVLWAHFAATLAAAVTAMILWSRRPMTLRALRAAELIVVGTATLLFALNQVDEFRQGRWGPLAADGQKDHVLYLVGDACVLRWFALLVFYGFFVPNTWRRCALVVGVVALCPLAIMPAVGLWEGTLGLIKGVLPDMGIWLGVGAATAVYGSHKIYQLRQQVLEARELGQYRLKKRLGCGGMGEVYLAEHVRLRRTFAIKLIRPEQAGDRTTLLRFEREVQATALLMHPNTVRVFDYGIAEDGTFYYAMEYLPGLTLQEIVLRYGPMPPGRAVYFLRQVCSALREAHGLGLIHRDIKPSNLIVCQLGGISDIVKLLDFGLVKATSGTQDLESLTLRGLIAGTPAYLSPEQAANRGELDARSDIYSLGVVGYFLLIGRPPFEGETPLHLLMAHLQQAAPPLSASGRECPADLEAVIARCLRKNPDDRFRDVIVLERALAACQCAGHWSESEAAGWWEAHRAAEAHSGIGGGPLPAPGQPIRS
jgi:eukaryotic-like serine/threonine-protein kinase